METTTTSKRPNVLSKMQRYSIATALAVNSLPAILAKLNGNQEARAFATAIDKHYRKRDGFVPSAVIRIVNS